ncbi:MAG: asparagine synthase (glutamine-hydrolyzing) [Ignavibacteriae bacterium]|nr:asparagine synthase (glutamine-hydrolyzing) [Ignavibacteriota bacterium]
MCGIAGFNWNDSELGYSIAKTLEHRGPDAQGVWSEDNVTLCHRRLSIIDLSEGGNQPMLYRNYVISFNGEIYNYKELRTNLKSKGHQFVSLSDTEVILHAYEEYGVNCLTHFNGMFAFCIYDKTKNQLFIARDRLGQKPLYFYHSKKKFIFASEIKAIKAIPHDFTIDHSAVYDYFTYGYVPAPKSYYKEINKLEAGNYLIYSLSSCEYNVKKYWSPLIANQKVSFHDLTQELDFLLNDAINLRLRSDVPVGVFLSAGLDSTTIASRLGHENITCFNVDFADGETEKVVKFCKEKNLSLKVDNIEQIDYQNSFRHIMSYFDEPFADNSSIPTYFINKTAANNGFKVMLSGDGGDELFVGYKRYKQLELFNLPLKSLFKPFSKALNIFQPGNKYSKALFFLSQKDIRDYYIKLKGGFVKEELNKIFTPDFLYQFRDYNAHWVFDKYWSKDELPLIKKAQIFDIFSYLPDDILVKEDRMSMANSLEARSPFLDYRIFELILQLDLSSYYNGNLKSTLKVIQKKHLPGYIIKHKKQGFGYNHNQLIAKRTENSLTLPSAKDFLLNQKKIFYLNSLYTFMQ